MDSDPLDMHEFETSPEPTERWNAAEQLGEETDVPPPTQIGDTDRKAWYCPTTSIWDAHRARHILDAYGVERVYDLGGGDCRVGLWLAEEGYDVVAYELLTPLAEAVRERFGDTPRFEIRNRDYFEDYDECVSEGAVIAFGGTNELPYIPERGLAIEGYCEIGIRAHYDGEVVAAW